MKSSANVVVAAMVCFALGFGLRSMTGDTEAVAAQAAEEPSSRYVVSAYSGPAMQSYGCYVIDTTTGELWQVGSTGKAHALGPVKAAR